MSTPDASSLLEGLPLGAALVDAQGLVLSANAALAALCGASAGALLGRPYDEALGPWAEAPAAQTLASGAPARRERALTVGGQQLTVEVRSFLAPAADGAPLAVELWDDVTERAAAQAALASAERMAAFGRLAAGIAHEIGNPLQAMQGFLTLFLEQCAADTPNRLYLELAEQEAERMVQLLGRLRSLYRAPSQTPGVVDMNQLVGEVLTLAGRQVERAGVRLLRELGDALPPLHGVADQLRQVLLILALNALEGAAGGLLHVQTYRARCGQHPAVATALTYATPADTPEQHVAGALHASRAIVAQHGGHLAVQRSPGEATTVTLLLPI